MRRSLLLNGFVVGFFLFITIIAFRQYIFGGLVPIQFNLLPAFYSPWKYETWSSYERGVPNKPIGTDNPKLFYPYRKFTTEELKQGRLPLWNPYVFSGNVHAATYQTAVWYPLNFLYFILPQADAWSILILLQPILVGWFTFLFMKSQGLSGRASIFGATAFTFSGWMIAWWEESIVIVHSILWLPLALYASARKRWLLLIVALSMSLLAGFLQMSLYLFGTVLFWNVFLWYQQSKEKFRHPDQAKRVERSLANARSRMRARFLDFARNDNRMLVGIAFIAAILVTSIQWLPALEAYLLSPRGTVAATFLFDQYLVPLRHLVTLLVPDFWGNPGSYNYFFPRLFYHEKAIWVGLFPLIFAILGALVRKNRRIRFWTIGTIVVLSLGFALPTSWVWYVLRVPVLSSAQPARIFILFAFGASMLAAYGMETWLFGRVSKKRVTIVFVSIVFVLSALWGFVLFARWRVAQDTALSAVDLELYGRYATISFRNLFIPTLSLFVAVPVLLFIKNNKVALAVVVVATVAWSLYAADKFLYFSDRRFEFPLTPPIAKLKELTSKDYARVWGYGDASVTPNMLSYYGLYSSEGYDALFSQRYGELLHTIKSGGLISDQIDRTDAVLKGLTERDPMDQSPIRLQLMSLLGVRYILELKSAEHKEGLPEDVRFPPALFGVAWENDTWRIWEYTKALPRAWFTADGDVAIRRYEPSFVELDVKSSESGTVVLSDTYYPGWIARVDGRKKSIERVHDVLRGIHVDVGEHTIELRYEPLSFQWGVILSVVGLMLSGAVALGQREALHRK